MNTHICTAQTHIYADLKACSADIRRKVQIYESFKAAQSKVYLQCIKKSENFTEMWYYSIRY